MEKDGKLVDDNDAGCGVCKWRGKAHEIVIKKTFADEHMDRLRTPPVR
jgi:hypothetical protein